MHEPTLDIDALRRRLSGKHGRTYWRSLEEIAATPEFEAFLADEFPRLKAVWDRPLDRRGFLRISAAAMAMAGVTACRRQPPEDIVPYVRMPEHVVPGESLYYATTLDAAGAGVGVLVETREGRPLRIEGNARHPASLGALDVLNQASILSLYDPDRSHATLHRNRTSTYAAFQAAWAGQRRRIRQAEGRGFAILTPPLQSPSQIDAVQDLLRQWPQARWYVHNPLAGGADAGAMMAFGRRVEARYHLENCARILSLDADFLFQGPGALASARHYADGRAVREGPARSSRLYAVESHTTVTGAKADHHHAVRPSEVENVARHLARLLGVDVPAVGDPPVPADWLRAVADDLQRHGGRSVVIPGPEQTPAAHALTHAINHQLGNAGTTVVYGESLTPEPGGSLDALMDAIRRKEVDTLVIAGGNPVYTSPADIGMADALEQVPFSVHWGLHTDETAVRCQWHVPAAHALESWGDARAFDGTASPVQPVLRPLYNGVESLAFLKGLTRESFPEPREQVRGYWREHQQQRGAGIDFERYWKRSLHDGVFAGSAPPPVDVSLQPQWQSRLPEPAPPADLEIRFAPDPALGDGSFANNAWLQELPKPLTKIVWGNALLINPATAAEIGIDDRELVEITSGGRTVTAPAFWHPGAPRRSVTVHLGYGRDRAGRVGTGLGTDAYRLRRSDHLWFAPVALRATGRRGKVITTQLHHSMEGRSDKIAHEVTLEEVRRKEPVVEDKTPRHSLYPEREYDGYAWGMTVDINACIGCNACVIACQSENNIPTVGPREVERGHEMHWLRIDRYYKGPVEHPETIFQPVPCMHCEKAPCEYVCPVHATTHSSEGINEMTYNRCIGTRFCSQNCPYKVRRFNFFDFTGDDATTPAARATHNPEVTVRSRGVMEKCTYCIQRINRGRMKAQKENRRIRDGEVRTACQDACPTQAIVFGDINDPDAHVTRLKASELNYAMLAELNTRPRTTYLAGVRHPNPDIRTHEEDD